MRKTILEKRLEGYSSIERAAIEQLGDEAFSRTMKYLKEQEEKDGNDNE